MSFWEFIAGAAQKSWENKPRRDVAASVVELRDAMTSCRDAYEDYSQLLASGEYEKEMKRRRTLAARAGVALNDPRQVWEDSVFKLGDVLYQIGPLLNIFSPETFKSVTAYHQAEAIVKPLPPNPPNPTKRLIDKRFSTIANAIQQPPPSFVDTEPQLDANFEETLSKLDAFIKQNFKLEEIYRAQRQI